MPAPLNPAGPLAPKAARQPLLWTAVAYGTGTAASAHIWRPATWWFATILVSLLAAAFWTSKRTRCAQVFALIAVASLAIVAAQLGASAQAADPLPSNSEVVVFAHIVGEHELLPTMHGGFQQTIDVVTERVDSGVANTEPITGLRVNVFSHGGSFKYVSGKALSETADATTSELTPTPSFPALHYGDRLRFPAHLRLPRNYRNPGAFDYVGYLRTKGISATASVRAENIQRLQGFTGNRWELVRTRIHHGIIATIHHLWPAKQAALIDAMVIGDDAFIDRDTRADLQRSGTYHILVVSGMNVGILAFVSFWLLRKFRSGDLAASILTMAMAVLYAILTDVGAPVWRAVLMMTVYLGARLLYRERSMLNALGAAALALMLMDPQAVLGASFQLTFLCVLAIAAVGVPLLERTSAPYRAGLRHLDSLDYDAVLPPRVAQFRLDLRMVLDRLKRFPGRRASGWMLLSGAGGMFGAFDLIVISALMQVSLALPMAYYFHRATSFGIPANLLVVPLTEVLMPTAVAAVGLGYVSHWLAWIPAALSSLALAAITGTVRGLGGMRLADLRVATPQLWVVVAASLSLAAAMLLARRRWRWTVLGLAAVAGSALWIGWGPPHAQIRRGVLEVTSIDVGEGDSSLIVTPGGKTMLIDAGGPTGDHIFRNSMWAKMSCRPTCGREGSSRSMWWC